MIDLGGKNQMPGGSFTVRAVKEKLGWNMDGSENVSCKVTWKALNRSDPAYDSTHPCSRAYRQPSTDPEQHSKVQFTFLGNIDLQISIGIRRREVEAMHECSEEGMEILKREAERMLGVRDAVISDMEGTAHRHWMGQPGELP